MCYSTQATNWNARKEFLAKVVNFIYFFPFFEHLLPKLADLICMIKPRQKNRIFEVENKEILVNSENFTEIPLNQVKFKPYRLIINCIVYSSVLFVVSKLILFQFSSLYSPIFLVVESFSPLNLVPCIDASLSPLFQVFVENQPTNLVHPKLHMICLQIASSNIRTVSM